MIATDKEKFAIIMLKLAENFNKKLTLETLELYWQKLSKFSYFDVKNAFNYFISRSETDKYFPKINEINCFIVGSSEIRGFHAWTKVTTAVQIVGSYSSITFDDHLIHLVILDKGGWIRLCHLNDTQLSFYEHQFYKRYAAYIMYPPLTFPKKLIGILEQQNPSTNLQLPVLYGDKDKAMSVYLSGSDQKLITSMHQLTISNEVPQQLKVLEHISYTNNY